MLLDLHSHSVSSDDSRSTVEQYLKWIHVLRKKGYTIDGMVLTEHRKFDLHADYSSLARRYEILVLKGSELDTRYGHFLVYGVNEKLHQAIEFSNVTLDPIQLIEQARLHGAIAIPAHPGRARIGLCGYIEDGVEFPGVEIVETLNGGSRSGENDRALQLAEDKGYRGIGGSDAHLTSAIASCLTSFDAPIRDEGELVEALRGGQYHPVRLKDQQPESPQDQR